MLRNLPLIRDWQRFVPDSSGAAGLIFAFALPVMLGFAGLAIEVGDWFLNQRAMQGAADAAAISAATALSLNSAASPNDPCNLGGTNICTVEATSVAAMNGWTNGHGVTLTVLNPPTSGQYAGNTSAVQVIITKTGTNWFSTFLPASYVPPTLGASSVALARPGIDCMLSLNGGSATGVSFLTLGIPLLGPGINMPNCSIGVNSTNGLAALSWLGDVPVNAYSATVVGGIFPPPALGIGPPLPLGFNWTRTPVAGPAPPGPPTPDPYACPGNECRSITPVRGAPAAIAPLGTTAVPGSCTGAPITTSGTLPGGCSQGITVTNGRTVNLATATGTTYTIVSQCITTTVPGRRGGPPRTTRTCTPAINVTGGRLNITGGGNLTILGDTAPAVQVTGGTVNLTTGNNIIQGASGQPGIVVSGGTTTITATGNSVLGGSNQPGVNITGGNLTFATGGGTNTFEGGRRGPGIQVLGDTPRLTIDAATNDVLAGAGSAAIIVDGTAADSPYARLWFGNGNNNIQGAASDAGAFSAMTINGFGQVVIGNGTTVFGGRRVRTNVPAVDDHAFFTAGSGNGLVLGSGTFQFMEGLSVTGGDLTLNPPSTANPANSSGGIGYYIMDGGGASGFNMTFGNLTGTNATIILTGGAAGGVSGTDYASINYNGANGITLTAPTTAGTWNTAGIAIYQDRNATSGNANVFSGGIFGNITGAIYTPSEPITFFGIGIMNSQCLQMIASTITIAGVIYMNDSCEGTGTAPIGGTGSIVLVQ